MSPPKCAVFPIGSGTNSPIIIKGTIATIGSNQKDIDTGKAIFLAFELKENITNIETIK